ncbi:MAG: hypothetical protein MRZ66_02210, partial [Clostridiales bacterium]|nr:hypothetical protein [Clostridiales bacterium]
GEQTPHLSRCIEMNAQTVGYIMTPTGSGGCAPPCSLFHSSPTAVCITAHCMVGVRLQALLAIIRI